MGRVLSVLCSLLAAAGLYACDAYNLHQLKPGISTAQEVRDRMGPPEMEWTEADGSRTWEYPRTPEGKENYMLVIGPDGILQEIRQVLTEENFARIRMGMTQADIRRLLGKPARVTPFPLKRQEVWEWPYANPHRAEMRFNVHFDLAGKVVETSRHEEHLG